MEFISQPFTEKLELTWFKQAALVFFGSIVIAFSSQIRIEFFLVPITFQVPGIMLLAMTMGPRLSTYSVVLYLVQATMGWPVLAPMASIPLWITHKTAGYLLGFIPGVFIAARMIELRPIQSLSWTVFSIYCGNLVINFIGAIWLGFYFMSLSTAFFSGFVPFLANSFINAILIGSLHRPYLYARSRLQG